MCRWFHQAPILAMAIRLAMCIGINNVNGDKAGEVPPPGLCKREVGCSGSSEDLYSPPGQLWRRIWFNIVYLDWRFSVPMGETYFINHFHYNTVRPANLDWKDMNDGTVFRPQPRGSFTVRISCRHESFVAYICVCSPRRCSSPRCIMRTECEN